MTLWLKRIVFVVLFIALLVFFVNFVLSNTAPMSLSLAGITTPLYSSATIVMVAFVVGGVVGLLVAGVTLLRLRFQNSRLLRRLHRRDTELQKLKAEALKELTNA